MEHNQSDLSWVEIDRIVGATRFTPDASLLQAGRVDAYSRADGFLLRSHPDLIVAGSTAGPNAEGKTYFNSGKDGARIRTITGNIPGDSLGVDALGLGDLNHDRREDFMLTAVGLDFAGLEVGHVYVVSLRPFHPGLGKQD